VSLVSPALDPGSTTIEVWVETRKPSAALRPGMTVSIEVTAKTVPDGVAVPTAAVFTNADGAYYVVIAGQDQKAHQKVVQLGVKNSELTQIADGISAGDPVITSGGYAIPDGTSIQVEKSAPEEKSNTGGSSEKPEKTPGKNSSAKPTKDQE
jgi:HlyD family secretion protein